MSELPPPVGPPVTSSRPYEPPPGYVHFAPEFGAPSPGFKTRAAPHPTLPIAAAIGAVVVLTASLLVSKYVLDGLLQFEWPVVAYVALLAIVGYGPSLLWCAFVSRRWGSGRFLTDVGFRPRWMDLAWAPVVWLGAIGTQLVIGVIVLIADVPIANNTEGVSELSADRTYVISLILTAVVAAPFVEEIVFRGVVLRGLLSRMPIAVSIALQAVLFGVAHADPVRGAGNIGLVLVLTGVGAAFGVAAYLFRRIGPTIGAHAIFNGVVLLIVLLDVQERLGG